MCAPRDLFIRARVQQCTLEVDCRTFLGGNQKCRQPVCDACHLSSAYPNKLSALWTPSASWGREGQSCRLLITHLYLLLLLLLYLYTYSNITHDAPEEPTVGHKSPALEVCQDEGLG